MKNKKRVLFVTNKCPHYRMALFNDLAKKSDVTFYLTDESKRIEGLRSKQIISSGKGISKLRVHPSLIREIKSEKYDYVFMLPPDAQHLINNYLIYFACKKKKIPFIFWTERWQYFEMPIRDKISNFLHRFLLRKAYKILVAGKKSKEWIEFCGIRESKIIVAPNASEIHYDKKEMSKIKTELIKKYKLKDKKVVLYLGRLINRKGIKYLIDAFYGLKENDTVLMIVGGGDFYKLGEGSVESKLKNQVKKLGISDRVIFTGEIEHSETSAYYSLAEIFVYPSITEGISEPWGLTLNEAMQFELPIISTDAVGAAYDLIKHGENGFLVKEKSSEELITPIKRILNNDNLRKSMGRLSKKIVDEKNSYSKMLDGFMEAIK